MWQDMGKQPTSRTMWFFNTSIFSLPNLKKIILTLIFLCQILQVLANTHAKFDRLELEALLKGRARCLKAAT